MSPVKKPILAHASPKKSPKKSPLSVPSVSTKVADITPFVVNKSIPQPPPLPQKQANGVKESSIPFMDASPVKEPQLAAKLHPIDKKKSPQISVANAVASISSKIAPLSTAIPKSKPAKVQLTAQPVSVSSRIFAYQAKIQPDEVPKVPCPEKLSLKERTKLFEEAIRKESGDAAQVRMRDEHLRSRKVCGGPEAKKTKLVNSAFNPKAVTDEKALQTHKLWLSQASQEKVEVASAVNEEPMTTENTESNEMPSDSTTSKEAAERQDNYGEGAMGGHEDLNDLSVSSLSTGQSEGHYFATPYVASSLSQICTSQASVDSSTSEGSSRMYPQLPIDDNRDHLHSSPTKQTRLMKFEEQLPNISPVFANQHTSPKQDNTTPMRTLSTYRLEQKIRAQQTEEAQPAVVVGVTNSQANAFVEEKKRQDIVLRKVRELRAEVGVHDARMAQASKAVSLSMITHNGTLEHADAERLLLESCKSSNFKYSTESCLNF